MVEVSRKSLEEYRAEQFRYAPGKRVNSPAEAVEFVNQRGVVFFWPVKDTLMPSLWVAAAGNRPVPNNHDDAGHITWRWKDQMLGQRKWFYAKLLRQRSTIISNDLLPYFYALSPNYGDPQSDYLMQYDEGELSLEAKNIYEALLINGPLDTLELRKAAHLTASDRTGAFNKSLQVLQREIKIMPIGISPAGAWKYAFIFDTVPHHLPDLQNQARLINEKSARMKIIETYLRSVGAAQISDIRKIFQWNKKDTENALKSLIQREESIIEINLPNESSQFFLHPASFIN
jgi:hypothetical protein